MKVYITKYALTQGIIEIDIEKIRNFSIIEDKDMLCFNDGHPVYFHKGEWCRSKEEAIQDAEKKREKKVASLRKQLEKLENLKFE